MDAGIAMTLASSRFSSERVATMRRQPGAARVCASRRQRSSTYFDSMAMPPNPGPTKSISFRCPGPSGPEWFASQGRHGGRGLRSYSVSGRVKSPGVKLAPAGVTLRELVDEFCGGMAEGHELRGYLPGGASGGVLPASMADLPLEFGKLEAHGCFVGSHAVVVLSDRDDMKAVALNLMRFFEDESCGQCTPCRVGTEKAVKLMERGAWDEPLLVELGRVMSDASICGLGQAAVNPLNSVLRHFREDVGLGKA